MKALRELTGLLGQMVGTGEGRAEDDPQTEALVPGEMEDRKKCWIWVLGCVSFGGAGGG